MKASTHRGLGAIACLLGATIPWAFESDVVRLVALRRPVLLGRYAYGHFMALLVASLLLLLLGLVLWSCRHRTRKELVFRLVGLTLALGLGTGLAALGARFLDRPAAYRTTQGTAAWPGLDRAAVTSRPPDSTWTVTFDDAPPAWRSYPDAPQGAPARTLTLTTDARGYRNRETHEQAEVVVLGDSFAEGNRVSDEEAWPARVAAAIDRTVLNLGMSGSDPDDYAAALGTVGLPRKPRVVVLMLYGDNDFKGRRADAPSLPSPAPAPASAPAPAPAPAPVPSLGDRLDTWQRDVALLRVLRRMAIRLLGPVGQHRDVQGLDALAWLPVPIGPGPDAPRYAFEPKDVRRLHWTEARFAADPRWQHVASRIRLMRDMARSVDARLLVTYAPSKPRLVLPLAGDRVDPSALRQFVAYHRDKGLPDAETFHREVLAGAGAKEAVLAAFCATEQIAFAPITPALRDAMAQGERVYYCYDEHWTARGNALVADALAPEIARLLAD